MRTLTSRFILLSASSPLYATTLFMKRPSLGGPTMVTRFSAATSACVSSEPGKPEQVWKAMRVKRKFAILEMRSCTPREMPQPACEGRAHCVDGATAAAWPWPRA